jgi:hypothetical protein
MVAIKHIGTVSMRRIADGAADRGSAVRSASRAKVAHRRRRDDRGRRRHGLGGGLITTSSSLSSAAGMSSTSERSPSQVRTIPGLRAST